jgi:FkbH-like protein
VWDLDETLWHGTLLEEGEVRLRAGVEKTVVALDQRGILQSVASKNDREHALSALRSLNLSEYFLYPQIGWNSKAESIQTIVKLLNISSDTIAFVDDQQVERDEVAFSIPEVLCLGPGDLDSLLERPEFIPRFVTEDSALRRRMYQTDMERLQAEESYTGPKGEFLATLGMELTISKARVEDLRRAEELTLRTHQLNSTGYTYSYEELDHYRTSAQHLLLVCGLRDHYGPYGKIGLALIECGTSAWVIKLLLMSCRVMTRGVGSVLLGHIVRLAKEANAALVAEFVPNQKNRIMAVAYGFANFCESGWRGDVQLLENNLSIVPQIPSYMRVITES